MLGGRNTDVISLVLEGTSQETDDLVGTLIGALNGSTCTLSIGDAGSVLCRAVRRLGHIKAALDFVR